MVTQPSPGVTREAVIICSAEVASNAPMACRYRPGVQPVSRDELLAIVRERHRDHPWARLCTGPVSWEEAWDLGDAVAWRSGHPWRVRPQLHVLGAPSAAAAALACLARPAEGVVAEATTAPHESSGLGEAHRWDVRMRYAAQPPLPVLPGEQRVGWLPDPGGVAALLDAGNPDAAIRPGDPRGGRWCGARDEDGRLVAVAVETVLSPVPHLSSLAVRPDRRRQGWAQAVTSFFVREAHAGGAGEVMLAMDRGNDPAERLYDLLGFDTWPMAGFGV